MKPRKTALCALLVAAVSTSLVGCSSSTAPTAVPAPAASEAEVAAVVPAEGLPFHYFATGGGEDNTGSASVTMANPAGGTQQADVFLPLKDAEGFTGVGGTVSSGSYLRIAVQNKASFGSVTCQIDVDGIIVSENTSSGGYVIATCEYRVP